MVIHLVHERSDGTAVVAVLVKSGGENPAIQKLWANLPKTEGKEEEVANLAINAADLLPADRNYYTFDGSLTTPPCSEGVKWFVLKTPIEISTAQIATFAKFYPMNARPIQPRHGREVRESEFKAPLSLWRQPTPQKGSICETPSTSVSAFANDMISGQARAAFSIYRYRL